MARSWWACQLPDSLPLSRHTRNRFLRRQPVFCGSAVANPIRTSSLIQLPLLSRSPLSVSSPFPSHPHASGPDLCPVSLHLRPERGLTSLPDNHFPEVALNFGQRVSARYASWCKLDLRSLTPLVYLCVESGANRNKNVHSDRKISSFVPLSWEHSVPWTFSRCTLTPRGIFFLSLISPFYVARFRRLRDKRRCPTCMARAHGGENGGCRLTMKGDLTGRIFRARLKIQEDRASFYIRVFPRRKTTL